MDRRSSQSEIDHEDQEEGKLDAKGDQVGDQDRDRHRQAREVDLAEQVRIRDERLRGLRQAAGEVGPDHRAGHVEQELRQTVRGQLGDAAEDDREGDRRQQRLDQVPQRPQDGLLVDRDEVAPHEQHDQVAGAPQLAQAQVEPGFCGRMIIVQFWFSVLGFGIKPISAI